MFLFLGLLTVLIYAVVFAMDINSDSLIHIMCNTLVLILLLHIYKLAWVRMAYPESQGTPQQRHIIESYRS